MTVVFTDFYDKVYNMILNLRHVMIEYGSLPIKLWLVHRVYMLGILLYSILSVTMRHLDLVSKWFGS